MRACYGDLHVKIQWCQGNKGNKEEESNPRYVTKEESTREGERVKGDANISSPERHADDEGRWREMPLASIFSFVFGCTTVACAILVLRPGTQAPKL